MIITAIQTHQSTLIFQIICFFALFSLFFKQRKCENSRYQATLTGY